MFGALSTGRGDHTSEGILRDAKLLPNQLNVDKVPIILRYEAGEDEAPFPFAPVKDLMFPFSFPN